MDRIEPRVIEVLGVLADKLGVAAEFLWEVLVWQQLVDAFRYCGLSLLAVCGAFVCYRIAIWGRNHKPKTPSDESGGVAVGFGCAGIGVFAILTTAFVYAAVGRGLNPEYYALQEILWLLR